MKPKNPTAENTDAPPLLQLLQIGFALALVILSVLVIPLGHANGREQPELHAEVELISAHRNLKPDSVQDLALVVRPAPGWYTYWRNPGEVGKPTTIKWTLPKGIHTGEPEWPVPVRKVEDGGISYAFPEQHILPVAIAIGRELDFTQTEYKFIADVSWLACKDVCIPESTTVSIVLPLANASDTEVNRRSASYDTIQGARDLIPTLDRNIPARFKTARQQENNLILVDIPVSRLPAFTRKPGALVGVQGIVNEQVEPDFSISDDNVSISFQQDPYLDAVPEHFSLILTGLDPDHLNAGAIELHVEPYSNGVSGTSIAGSAPEQNSAPLSIATALLFAFLGGLILNAMPCVFPVLSLKVISLVESNVSASPTKMKKHRHLHGIAYTAGVVLSFLIVALTLILLRGLGEQIGWGFQLQSPVFIASLTIIIFVLGLSMSGVIEIGSGLQNLGNQGPANEGGNHWQGAFWTGVLATVVATPCTAPFMGTAMGFALSQPMIVTLTVFLAMALGLASPFLAIAFVPKLAALMPSPGMWMVRLKELLAFPLYLTAVWLMWVFARQAGSDAAAMLLVALVSVAMASWAWQTRFHASNKGAWAALSAAMLAATVYAVYTASSQLALRPNDNSAKPLGTSEEAYATYSQGNLDDALSRGDTILVNMTADWCITCKVNEKVALSSQDVKDILDKDGVTYLKGDWTNSDPAITRYLDSFGRNGVPLYVVYRPGTDPKILPQILTPSIVTEALEQ